MKLDEYKKMIEAQRKESLQNAISALTRKNNNGLSRLFR